MVPGRNDSGLLIGDVARPIHAVISLAGRVVSRTEPDPDGDTTPTSDDDRHVQTSKRRGGRETEKLVPPSERLLELIERNGGRMKQSDIVQVVEWSESTVSRKLGELESAGAVTRYRIGRGKIVFLPGAEPDCVGSPFDREGEEEEEEEKRAVPA